MIDLLHPSHFVLAMGYSLAPEEAMKRAAFAVLFSVACLVTLAGQGASGGSGTRASTAEAPIFEVDPFWPKPLPNHWVLGSTIGLSVDDNDHVWVIHRPQTVEDNLKAADMKPALGICCKV